MTREGGCGILRSGRESMDMRKTGRLPAVRLKSAARVSGKMLDRYRRYIVMAVIILNGEYPLLADYLQYVRKEGG